MFEEVEMTRFRGQSVGIATGGSSHEREISLQTGRAFEQALASLDYDVTVYDVASDLGQIVGDRPAAMLLGIHGGLGESGALQGFLESLAIPYTGSGVLASALAMDKRRARIVCDAAGIPVARGFGLRQAELSRRPEIIDRAADEVGFPMVAKLNDSGSSFGVYICRNRKSLDDALGRLQDDVGQATSSGVLIEEFIEGPEYTVGFFDDRCLGVVRIRPGEGFYDFEAKYESSDTEYDIVTDLAITEPLEQWSRAAFGELGCRGVARVDFKGEPGSDDPVVMLEANTIPGMTATSLVPKMAAHKGVEFADFVEAMLATARLDDG